jgi:uncharacterized protein YkwD
MEYHVDRSATRRQADLSRGAARAVSTCLTAALGLAAALGLVGGLGACSTPGASMQAAGPAELAGSAIGSPSSSGFGPGLDAGADSGTGGTAAQPGTDQTGDLLTSAAPPTPTTVPAASQPGRSAAAAARDRASSKAATARRSAAAKASTATSAAAKAAALLAAKGSAPNVTGAPLLLGPVTESVAEAEAVRLVNVERANSGCPAVVTDPTLVRLARGHSQDMAGAAGFKHNGSDGRTPFQRMTAVGYDYSVAAENIAAGQPNAAAVMAAWMASPGHRANILDCRFTQIGVGVVNVPGTPYVVYWTQEFGAPM